VSCLIATDETTSCENLTSLPRFEPFGFDLFDFEPSDSVVFLLLLLLFQLLFFCDFAGVEALELGLTSGLLFMLLLFFAEEHCRL